MKALTCRCLPLLAALMILNLLPLSAQTESFRLVDKTYPVGDFTALEISDDFDVTLTRGASSVKLTVDEPLLQYVDVYVRSKTLFVVYNEKSVPKEIKKQYKGSKAPKPVFRVSVSLDRLTGISLSDKAVLLCGDEFNASDKLEVTLSDKAQLKGLSAEATTIKVNLRKNAQASMNLRSLDALGRIEVSIDDNAKLKMTAHAYSTTVTADDNAEVTLSGENTLLTLNSTGKSRLEVTDRTESTTCTLSGNSDIALTGSTDELSLKADGRAELDAPTYAVKRLKAVMTGGKATVSVSDELEMDLSGGSSLTFSGTPAMKIIKIEKSTLLPRSTSDR